MHEETIHAWHALTREAVRLRHKDGKIVGLDTVSEKPKKNLWIAPALLELQVNGYGGVDWQNLKITAEELQRGVERLHRDACGAQLLTLVTRPWPEMIALLKRIVALRSESPYLKAGIAGFHIEGPFMSPEHGFVGAHNPEWMESPTPEKIHALRDAAGDLPILLTVAPERDGVLENIALATRLGIRISLGHTNASLDTVRAAVEMGAVAYTHLGNGIPQQLDRHDNIVWRVFEHAKHLTVGVIPDRVHVSPLLFRTIHRVMPPEHIYYTTDAVSPAGMPPGRYRLGTKEFDVGEDQVVREPGRQNFSGSAARCIEVLFRAAEMAGCPWQEAWGKYSTNPARLMGIDWELRAGKDATFCMLEMDGAYTGQYTMVLRGEKLKPLPAKARLEGAGF